MRTFLALIVALVFLSACGANNGTNTLKPGQPGQGAQQAGWTQQNQTTMLNNCNAATLNAGYLNTSLDNAYCTCVLNAIMQVWTPSNVPTDSSSQQLVGMEQSCANSTGISSSGGN